MADFNVEAAKKAGYSETEIADHLATSRGFDIAGARKSGYSDRDIVSHLSGGKAEQPTAKAEKPGFFSRAYDASIGGVVHLGKEIFDKGAPKVADEMGTAIKDRYVSNPQKTNNMIARTADAVFGPAIDSVAGDIQAGNYAGAAGGVVGNLAMAGAPQILKGAGRLSEAAAVARAGRAAAAPVEQVTSTFRAGPMAKAVEYAEKVGLPTTVGERTGSKLLQKAERLAEVTPGASDVSTDFYSARNAKVAAKGADIVDRLGGAASDTTGAGEAVLNRIKGRSEDLSEYSSKKYDSVYKSVGRDAEKRTAETKAAYDAEVKQVEKYNRAEMAYANTRRQLVYESGGNHEILPEPQLKQLPKPPAETIAAPIEMAPVKRSLRPLFQELERTYTTTQKESSPGYTRIKAIMDDQNAIRSAVDVDKDLSEIKGVVRRESKGYAETKSGRYAMATIDPLEAQMQSAIQKAGGDGAVENLYKARKAVQEMHRTYEALDEVLPKKYIDSPTRLFESMVAKGDRNIGKLQEIKARAPEAIREIGATYLEGALQKISGEGGEADMLTASNQWKRLGPRTKQELYGADLTKELNSFFENTPQLVRNINKSGSGYATQAARVLNLGGLLIGAFSGGAEGMIGGAVTAAAGTGSANAIAKFLFKPGNAKLLENTMRSAKTPSALEFYSKRLNAAIEKDPGLAESLRASRIAKSGEVSTEQQ